MKETYTSLQEEIEIKTKKLQKVMGTQTCSSLCHFVIPQTD